MVGISIRNVSKCFGAVKAVDNVSLEIKKGEFFFILGPSGCGKTTLLRIIAGFYPADRGEVYFDHRLMNSVPPHKRNTGMVFQNYALWPHMTVAQNVAYGLEERKIRSRAKKEKVEKALQIVRMTEYADRTPNQLSGGQQQRVALARALVIEPDVILMDEPLSNLDAKLRLEMRYEIRRIHRETGITMVYVTHDQKEALSMAERIAVMSMGRVEQVGTPREVYRSPKNRFVAEFIGEINLIPGKVAGPQAGGLIKIATAIGDIRATCIDNTLSPGDEVLCSIRPECIRLGRGGTSKENTFPARLKSTTYLGEIEEYHLDCSGLEIKAVVLNPDVRLSPVIKDLVISVDPQDVCVFPKEHG